MKEVGNLKFKQIFYIGLGSILVAYLFKIILKNNNVQLRPTKGIIIGDSQTPYIAKQTTKALLLGNKGSESNLWKGGETLTWLKNAVDKYPKTNDVGHVVINIGTNGAFRQSDDIEGLIKSINNKFPNAKLYTVQGSWGWGGNENVTEDKVKKYYSRFKNKTTIINPPIGKTSNPHGNLPIYKDIGKSIDLEIEKNK